MIQTLFGSGEGKKSGFLDRMKQAVARTRESLNRPIEDVFLGKEIVRETLAELESSLIAADLGVATTRQVLAQLRERADRKQIQDVAELKRLLKQELLGILTRADSAPRQVV